MLHYDQRSRRFVGTQYLVAADAFFARVRCLCQSGENIPAALDYLCDEASWSPDMAGVEPLYTADAVIAEAEAILLYVPHH